MRRAILVGILATILAGCNVETFEDGSVIIDTGSLVVTVPAFDSPDDRVRVHVAAQRQADALNVAAWEIK